MKPILLLSATIILAYAFALNPNITPGGDDAQYILLSESINKGLGYVRLYLPHNPPEEQFPFVFSTITYTICSFLSKQYMGVKICLSTIWIVFPSGFSLSYERTEH